MHVCVCESEERYTRLDSQAKLTLDTVFNLRWTEKRSNPGKEEDHMMGCCCRYGRGKVFIPPPKKNSMFKDPKMFIQSVSIH